MKFEEAKQQFIQSWGVLGSQWGINRTMAQVHALLLIAPNALSTDDIMEQLQISRGNAHMNIRELMNWQLVDKLIVPGDRKEYFEAEKDIWKVARLILAQRKKKELDPMIKVLTQIATIEGDKKNADVKLFTDRIGDIKKFASQADKAINVMMKAEESWFWGSFLKIFK